VGNGQSFGVGGKSRIAAFKVKKALAIIFPIPEFRRILADNF